MAKQSRTKKKKMELKRELSMSQYASTIQSKLNEVLEIVAATKSIAENTTTKLENLQEKAEEKHETPQIFQQNLIERPKTMEMGIQTEEILTLSPKKSDFETISLETPKEEEFEIKKSTRTMQPQRQKIIVNFVSTNTPQDCQTKITEIDDFSTTTPTTKNYNNSPRQTRNSLLDEWSKDHLIFFFAPKHTKNAKFWKFALLLLKKSFSSKISGFL